MLRVAPLSGEAKPKRKVSHVREGLAVSAILLSQGSLKAAECVDSAYRAASATRKGQAYNSPNSVVLTNPKIIGACGTLPSYISRSVRTQDHVIVHGCGSCSRNCAYVDNACTTDESSSCGVLRPLPKNSGVMITNYSQEYRTIGVRIALEFQVHC